MSFPKGTKVSFHFDGVTAIGVLADEPGSSSRAVEMEGSPFVRPTDKEFHNCDGSCKKGWNVSETNLREVTDVEAAIADLKASFVDAGDIVRFEYSGMTGIGVAVKRHPNSSDYWGIECKDSEFVNEKTKLSDCDGMLEKGIWINESCCRKVDPKEKGKVVEEMRQHAVKLAQEEAERKAAIESILNKNPILRRARLPKVEPGDLVWCRTPGLTGTGIFIYQEQEDGNARQQLYAIEFAESEDVKHDPGKIEFHQCNNACVKGWYVHRSHIKILKKGHRKVSRNDDGKVTMTPPLAPLDAPATPYPIPVPGIKVDTIKMPSFKLDFFKKEAEPEKEKTEEKTEEKAEPEKAKTSTAVKAPPKKSNAARRRQKKRKFEMGKAKRREKRRRKLK